MIIDPIKKSLSLYSGLIFEWFSTGCVTWLEPLRFIQLEMERKLVNIMVVNISR